MSISSELLTLNNTKTAIRTAINNKGGSVEASAPFASYATAIDNLPSGGDDSALRDLIEGDITTLNIPSGTTGIKEGTFQSCASLTSISIPNTVTSIGDRAFSGCSALQSINIPSSVTTLGSQCFAYCSGLTSITIPDSVTTIPSYLVNYCNNLTEIIVGNNVSTIQSGAFSTSNNNFVLSAIVINTTTVPNLQSTDAFNYTHNCPIYVPAESLNAYKTGYRWSDLASRIYPIQQVATVDGNPVYNYEIGDTDGIVMGSGDMANMPTGTSLELAEGITSVQGVINGYTTVSLPSTMSYLGVQEVIGSSVTTLTCLATTPPTVQVNNLGGSGLTAIYVPYGYGSTYQAASGWSTFSSIIQELPAPPKAVLTLTNNTVVNVPGDGTTTLSKNNVTAVATITDIASAVVNEGITAVNSGFGVTGAFDGATNMTSVTLPSTLTSIASTAFRNTALTSISIPENVTQVSASAFQGCPLTSITVDANNSTYTSRNNCNAVIETTSEILILGCSSTVIDTDVEVIGVSAFKGRTSLTSVTIPDGSLTEIQDSAFYGCTNLTSVTCQLAYPPTLGPSVFDNTNNCPIYVPAEAVEDYAGDWVDYEDRIQAIPSA